MLKFVAAELLVGDLEHVRTAYEIVPSVRILRYNNAEPLKQFYKMNYSIILQ